MFKLSVVRLRLLGLWMRVRLRLGVWKDPAIGAANRLGVGVGILTIVGALLLVIVFLPQLAIDPHGLSRTDWLKAVQDLRTTILQGLGGLALLGTLYFSARTLRLNRRGQLTERFTKAVDQLSQPVPEQLAVRLGGIYALEQIALDSEELHWPVMEVLSACLRESSRTADLQQGISAVDDVGAGEPADQGQGTRPQVPTDLQAIATVLGRRPEARRRQEGDRRLDLERVRLPKADLAGAKLQRANLDCAELQRADFKGAKLRGAGLVGAQLQHADFTGAQLQNAYLIDAHLEDAILLGAQLEGAYLRGAHLEKAILLGADLTDARDLTRDQLKGALLDSETRLPEYLVNVPTASVLTADNHGL